MLRCFARLLQTRPPAWLCCHFYFYSAAACRSTYYGRDGQGHGTHVAGIIGARNNGAGVVGVVPGAPILACKALGASGSGSLDAVWRCYSDVLTRLQRGDRIAAINLSLGAVVTDAATVSRECDWVTRIAAFGTGVIAAAGVTRISMLCNNCINCCNACPPNPKTNRE